MENTQQEGSFPPGVLNKMERRGLRGVAARFVPLLLALTWICAGALVVNELNARASAALSNATQMRASLAAACLNQRLNALLRASDPTQTAMVVKSSNSSRSSGMEFHERNAALEVIPTVERAHLQGAASLSSGLDQQGLSAAEKALATGIPHVSAAHTVAGGSQNGIDIWLRSPAKDDNPSAISQVRVPVSFLNETLRGFSGGPWVMAVTDPTGLVLARLRTIDDAVTAQSFGSPDSYLERSSGTSALGLRVRAATSLAPLQSTIWRNWICFALVTSLMAAATMTFAQPIPRASKKGNDKVPTQKRRQAYDVMGAETSQEKSEAGHLTHSDDAFHPPASQQRGDGTERLRMALESAGMCAWEWYRDNGAMIWGSSCSPILKPPDGARAITARDVLRRIFPHERRRLLNMVCASLTQARPLIADVRLRRFDGEFCWLSLRAQPIMDNSGQVIGLAGIAQDITAQKQSLSRTDSLLREVSHRSKNMLALILAMARLTAREAVDVQSHLREFALRVAGLAASQDLIVAADWQSVDFSTLAAAEIEAVARSDATRIELSGPPLLITPEAAQTLGMILTELSLDSARHGALSVATGKVNLSWTLDHKRMVTISWREIGGPGRHPDREKGYGMSVIERFSTQGLKLEPATSGDTDGFTWQVSGPLANIGSVSSRGRSEGRA